MEGLREKRESEGGSGSKGTRRGTDREGTVERRVHER
jgi:hypothetical protein